MRASHGFRKILVAIRNPGARSLAHLAKAAQLARAGGAELELFHDISNPVFIDVIGMRAELRALMREGRHAALTGLERLAAPLRATGLRVHTSAEWDYPAHESIIRRAARAGADLIVTPCRARHRWPSLLGYTDWSLLRDSPIPVLLVKSRRPYRRPRILAAIDPLHRYSKPSGLDASILRQALALGGALRSAPHVVHAYLPTPLAPVGADLSTGRVSRIIETQARSSARAALDRELRHCPIPAARRHLVEAHPVIGISRTARRLRAAIVVMGAVSRRGIQRLFIGNSAQQLLDELRCDLLVVKPEHFLARVPRSRRGVYFVSTMAYS